MHADPRSFFLFDNVLIYCKAGGSFRVGETGLGDGSSLAFKGRIPTRNLNVIDLEDGKGSATDLQ